MNASEMRQQFERAMGIVEALKTFDPDSSCSVDVGMGNGRICFFPAENHKEEATRIVLKLFGKLTKDKSGNVRGEKDGIVIDLFGVLKCEIVGYKKERVPKTVQTGDFIEREVPIYECRTPIARDVVELAEEVSSGNNS